MPIEIRELNIRVSVNQSPAESNESGGAASGGGQQGGGGGDKDQIVAECVEQVMDILKNKLER